MYAIKRQFQGPETMVTSIGNFNPYNHLIYADDYDNEDGWSSFHDPYAVFTQGDQDEIFVDPPENKVGEYGNECFEI